MATEPTNINTGTASQPTASFDKQLADIKSQAAKIVTASQKIDPNIKISTANAEMIGMPKVDIPTTKQEKPRITALDTVGTTPIQKTSQDIAREAILSQVPVADRDTISSILDISTGYQTEKGKTLESTADSILTQQLANITSTRDKALESSKMKEAQRIPELEAELESIRSEADVLEARRNSAIQAESRRQGVSTSAMQNNVASIDRDFSLEKANLAIRELASVGKINAATKLIDTKLDLKYGDLEAETALLTAQINAISPFLSREDQKAAETRLQLNSIVTNKIADARASDKALEEFKLQSYLFAQQNGATPSTLSQIMSSTSREDVASVGGGYIQDPMQKLQMQNIRSQMATDALNREKIQMEITQIKNPIDLSIVMQEAVSSADPVSTKSALASLLGNKQITAATKARISPALAVLNSVDELANMNIEGKFTGVGLAGRIKEGVKGLFNMKDPEATINAQNIEAINLKVQQWASGAALTEAQTAQVDRLTPTLNDSDKTVRTKLNGLYNFMLNTAETDLLTDGVNVQFPPVNLFEIADLYEKASPEQKALIDQNYFGKEAVSGNRSW